MWFSRVSPRSARRALPPGGQGPDPGLRRRSPRDAGARRAGGRAEGPARRETAAEGPPQGRFLLAWRDREAACWREPGVGPDQRSRRRAGRAAWGPKARPDGPLPGAAVHLQLRTWPRRAGGVAGSPRRVGCRRTPPAAGGRGGAPLPTKDSPLLCIKYSLKD